MAARGRPAKPWPSCKLPHPDGLRGGIEQPRRHLTLALIKHCRGCSACERFHSARFDRVRWLAAWRGAKFYMGRACERCGKPYRRVHDGACYACALERVGPLPPRAGRGLVRPLVKPDGALLQSKATRREAQRAAKLRAAADPLAVVRTAEAEGQYVRASGTLYADGRLAVRLTDAAPINGCFRGERVCIDDPHFELRVRKWSALNLTQAQDAVMCDLMAQLLAG